MPPRGLYPLHSYPSQGAIMLSELLKVKRFKVDTRPFRAAMAVYRQALRLGIVGTAAYDLTGWAMGVARNALWSKEFRDDLNGWAVRLVARIPPGRRAYSKVPPYAYAPAGRKIVAEYIRSENPEVFRTPEGEGLLAAFIAGEPSPALVDYLHDLRRDDLAQLVT